MKTKTTRIIRRIVIVIAIGITLLGSGCLSVFQEISAQPGGKIQTQVRFSISKALLTSLGEMTGDTEDTDEMFDTEEGPVNPENIPGLSNVIVNDLDNGVDVGIHFSGILGKVPSGISPSEAPFIPFEEGNTVTIGLPPLDEEGDMSSGSDSDEMAALFFASTRYQLLMDKKLYPNVSSAKVMIGSTEYPASVSEMEYSWLVEFPISYWIQA
ncbi:MAG: hypothetical protein KAH21_01725, partial [Spirochaetaceae bacterium]|nr:hypothetical protein [Spirochaetaceae bacterium]